MSYKTILVHADLGAGADGRSRLAARLARSDSAHLIGSAPTGVSRFIPPASLAAAGPAFAERCAGLRRDAADALARFERIAAEEGVDSIEARLVDDEADAAMTLQARYCDVAVVSQTGPGAVIPPLPNDLPEYLLLTSGRPVLVLPSGHDGRGVDGGALVAWDGSVEAARAIAAAVPLLRAARQAAVLGFGDDFAYTGSGPQACDEVVGWLRRHGIDAAATSRQMPCSAGDDIGEALLSAAADTGAGLLVMGGYGHARFRELLLGGVTATILRAMTLPVLLAH
jgi:nucleotide-binding universal stress UspA family protein